MTEPNLLTALCYTPEQTARIRTWIDTAKQQLISLYAVEGVTAGRARQRIERISRKGLDYAQTGIADRTAFAVTRIELAMSGEYSVPDAAMHAADVSTMLARELVMLGQPALVLMRSCCKLQAALVLALDEASA